MFDVSWSELLILGLVTLIFVGPKELPRFLGTLGKYMGVVRRQANEFRSVFEQAMREAEMEELQKEVRVVGDGVKASLDEATRSVEGVKAAAQVDVDAKPAPKALAAVEGGEPVPDAAPAPDVVPSSEAVPAAPDPHARETSDDENTILKPTDGLKPTTAGPV